MHYEQLLVGMLLLSLLTKYQPRLTMALIWPGGQKSPPKREQKEWDMFAMFKKDGGDAPSPDPAIGQAALKNAELGEEWLAEAKNQFAAASERQKAQDAIANEVTQKQMGYADEAHGWSVQDRARYEDTFVPMQDQFIDKANNWDSKERQDMLAGEAKADVASSAAEQKASTERSQTAMGVNPNSGRFAGVDRAAETSTALAEAGAQNQARNTSRKEAMSLQGDAINMGSGLGVNPASSLGLSGQMGSSAYGITSANNAQALSNANILQSGFSTAMNGYSNQASTLNSQYNSQLGAWGAQSANSANATSGLFSGLGSLAGMGMMAFSSKKLKEDKKPTEGALEAVESMPVESWKYKDGVSDGGYHVGPYAEDFQKATGLGDGTKINLVDGMGITMRAVQELSKKVDDLKGMGIKRPANKTEKPKPEKEAA